MKIIPMFAVIAASLSAAPSFAQTSNIDQAFLGGSEARATFTIPFGGQSSSQKEKPRLEFGIRQYRNQTRHDWVLNSVGVREFNERDHPNFIESKIGFTLSNETAFLINGQEMDIHRKELGLSTGEKIAIGVGAAAVVVVVLGAVWIDALGDASE